MATITQACDGATWSSSINVAGRPRRQADRPSVLPFTTMISVAQRRFAALRKGETSSQRSDDAAYVYGISSAAREAFGRIPTRRQARSILAENVIRHSRFPTCVEAIVDLPQMVFQRCVDGPNASGSQPVSKPHVRAAQRVWRRSPSRVLAWACRPPGARSSPNLSQCGQVSVQARPDISAVAEMSPRPV